MDLRERVRDPRARDPLARDPLERGDHRTTGDRDLDPLALVRGYRSVRDGRAIDFGVYARVERPGRVRVGDALEPSS